MSSTAQSIATVELPCGEPGCDHVEVGPEHGRGSAPFKLASHRYRIHGLKADGSRRPPPPAKGGSSSSSEGGARTVLATVSDIAGDVKGEGAPTEPQLRKAGAKLLQVGTAAFGAIMAETEDGITEELREEIEDTLTLTSSQANEIVTPLARTFAPTKVNKRFGRRAVDAAEVAAPVAELTLYAIQIGRYLRDRRRRREYLVANGMTYIPPAGSPAPPPPGPVDERNPGGTAIPGPVVMAGGAPSGGVVIDPSTAEGKRIMDQARRG